MHTPELPVASRAPRRESGVIRADTVRQFGTYAWSKTVRALLTNRNFRPIVSLRLCQAVDAWGAPWRWILPLVKMLHHGCTHAAAMDLPWRTRIGKGLCITHGWGLVVSEGATLGRNVTLFHGVTLGRKDYVEADGRRRIGYPTLEDDVWVGPHAIIVGDITIGRGSRIAGGTVVTDDVPAHSIVAGNPGRVIKSQCEPDVMNPFIE